MNRWTGIGRLVANPVYTDATDNKKSRATFSLAVNAGKNRPADFVECVCFDKMADHAHEYLHKGMKILAEGALKSGSYTNKEGQKIKTTTVWINNTEFCESKSADSTSNADSSFVNVAEGEDAELPFG